VTEIDTCPDCGTPFYISSQHVWTEEGVIRPRRDERQRLVLFECGNLDPVYRGIEEIIGTSVQHLVIDASRRYTREYMRYVLPEDVIEMIRKREMDLQAVFDSTFIIWKAMGYGKLTLVEVKYEGKKDDYIAVLAERPYSVPLAVGNFAGAIEAVVGREPGIEYEETSPGVYRITVFEAENPPELKSRLRWRDYAREPGPGKCRLDTCPHCDAPLALQEFKWDLANGSIRSSLTGRRMVMTGPAMIDPIFEELENELGEEIPRVVVEAQRRFVKSGFFAVEEVTTEEGMREKLAVRGLGYLEYLRMGRRGVELKMVNVALPLLGVGLAQGLFEKAFNVESRVEWELTPGGDLHIEVIPVTS
jgi:hypothetical protein